ncbi:MAG TPA: hypothetical protein VGO56_15240 [Pyrinomonadaceae bacterium]|nr:hypothetical protein [Pyrinomonadaceae bacterium]
MSYKFFCQQLMLIAMMCAAMAFTSCAGNTSSSSGGSSTGQSSPAPSPKSGLDADLEYVRKGQFTYVLVFSRKDGKSLDGDDSAFLKTNAPQVVDWVTSDPAKKYIVAGTNFDLAKGNLELLKKRFVVEDYTGK